MAVSGGQAAHTRADETQYGKKIVRPLALIFSLLVFAACPFLRSVLKVKSEEAPQPPNLKEGPLFVVLISDRTDAIITSVGSIIEASSAPVDLFLIGDSTSNERVRKHFGARLSSFLSMTVEDVEKDLISQGHKPIWTWNEWNSSSSAHWKNENTLHVADWDNLHTHAHELNHLRFYIPYLSYLRDKEHAYFIDDDILVQRDLSNLAKSIMVDLNSSMGMVSACNIWMWDDECNSFEFKNQYEKIISTPSLYGDRTTCKSADEKHCVPDSYSEFLKSVLPAGGERQQAWNFGFSLFALRNWKALELTERYERVMKESYRLHVFPETSQTFGLGVAYLAFAGAVECWDEDAVKIRDGFGFIEWERYQATFGDEFFSSVDVAHYTGPEKPWKPYSSIDRASVKPWRDMMQHEDLPLPPQLSMEPTEKVFTILSAHNSGADWLMSKLDKHPQVCATGEEDKPASGFPREALSSLGTPWLKDCSLKKGCTLAFIRDSIWSLTANITEKYPVPPRCVSDYDPMSSGDPLALHLERLCNFVQDLHGDYSYEAIVLKWMDAFVSEDKRLLGCGCKPGTVVKGMQVMANWISSGQESFPNIPNLEETQLCGAKVVRVKRHNLWARYLSSFIANEVGVYTDEVSAGKVAIESGKTFHIPVEEMLEEIRYMKHLDYIGDEWAEQCGSDVLKIEYEHCGKNPSNCLEEAFSFIGVDSSKWASKESSQAMIPPILSDHSVKSLLNIIDNKEEVVTALSAVGLGESVGTRSTNIHLLVYETGSELRTSYIRDRAAEVEGVTLKLFGHGQEFKGFGSKYPSVIPELEKLPAQSLAVISDGRDVLINIHANQNLSSRLASLLAFRSAYHELTEKYPGAVVISAEAQCCVTALSHAKPGDFYEKDGSRKKHACSSGNPGCLWNGDDKVLPWKRFMRELGKNRTREHDNVKDLYLNAGLITGKVGDLLRFIKATGVEDFEDDQAVLTDYMFQNPNSIVLDYHQRMFGNNRWVQGMSKGGCMFVSPGTLIDSDEQNGPLVHSETKISPLFLHSPGKFFECHDVMATELGLKSIKRWDRSEEFWGSLNGGNGGVFQQENSNESQGSKRVYRQLNYRNRQLNYRNRQLNYRKLGGSNQMVLDSIYAEGGMEDSSKQKGASLKQSITGDIARYCDSSDLNLQMVLLKWNAKGILELDKMKPTISNIGHREVSEKLKWFEFVQDFLYRAKPSSRGRVSLLVLSDALHLLDWTRIPPIPVIVFSIPRDAMNKPNFFLAPNPYDAEPGKNQWDIKLASEAKFTFEEKHNKLVWRGELHYPEPEPPRLKIIELGSKVQNHNWLNASSNSKTMLIEEMSRYRYQLDLYGVSGTTWGALRWKMCSGGLVFKVDSPDQYQDWWHDLIKPWLHYIPVKHDLSDLHEKWLWAERNMVEAKGIALAGKHLCLENVSKDSVSAYFQNVVQSISEATEEQVAEADAILEGRVDSIQLVGW